MTSVGIHKFADAIRQICRKAGGGAEGKPMPNRETAAEQFGEPQESRHAGNAGAPSRDRRVDVGRGYQQAGRHSH